MKLLYCYSEGFFSRGTKYSGFHLRLVIDLELYIGFGDGSSIDADEFADDLASDLGAETNDTTAADETINDGGRLLRELAAGDDPCIIITVPAFGISTFRLL